MKSPKSFIPTLLTVVSKIILFKCFLAKTSKWASRIATPKILKSCSPARRKKDNLPGGNHAKKLGLTTLLSCNALPQHKSPEEARIYSFGEELGKLSTPEPSASLPGAVSRRSVCRNCVFCGPVPCPNAQGYRTNSWPDQQVIVWPGACSCG